MINWCMEQSAEVGCGQECEESQEGRDKLALLSYFGLRALITFHWSVVLLREGSLSVGARGISEA